MKRATNENMIPKWIADIFKTKKEKRSEQDQVDLDRYVADLRMTDPERYERLQGILKHVDPDTGHLPTGLNTGNIDESVFDDIKVAGYKTWKYTSENGQEYYAKGRDKGEAARYLRLKYKLTDIDPSQIIDTQKGVGYIDDTVVAIYNRDYEPMDEMKNKLKKIIKELVADLPPTEKVSAMPGQDLKDQLIAAVASTNDPRVLMQLAIKFGGAGFKESDNLGEMKRKLTPYMSKAGASEYLKLAQSFAVENGQIVMKGGKQDVMFTNAKETRMKRNNLMEIIRLVIAEETNQTTMGLEQQGTVAYLTPAQRDKLIDLGSVSIDDLKKLGIEFRSDRNDIEFDNNVMYKVHGGSGPNPGVKLVSTGLKKRQNVTENKNKMKVNQLRRIIREEIEKVVKENALADLSPREMESFKNWKMKAIRNKPQYAKMSDEELLAIKQEDDRDYDLMRRELPDEF